MLQLLLIIRYSVKMQTKSNNRCGTKEFEKSLLLFYSGQISIYLNN